LVHEVGVGFDIAFQHIVDELIGELALIAAVHHYSAARLRR
jgi:hypothetical protein